MTEHISITLIPSVHKRRKVILLRFDYNVKLAETIKVIPGSHWSNSMKSWYFFQNEFSLNTVFNKLKPFAYIDYSSLKTLPDEAQTSKSVKTPIKEKVKIPLPYLDKLEQKRYSKNTQKIYTHYFADFIRFFKDYDLKEITLEEINNYILLLIRKYQISQSQQNQRINAIKFYYEKVLGRQKELYDIERPKKSNRLPNVLSTEEIKLMIDTTKNIKHKCIIGMLYSAGLRRSELANLKITSILSKQMLIKVENSKGNKDRYVSLSHFQLELLRQYYLKYKPSVWLFEGQNGSQFSGESILKIVKQAATRAGITRKVTPHMLRHSFATHHLEQGTDLRYIQEFLGHHSTKTTEIYTHVAKTDFSRFQNPLDGIYETKKDR